MTDPTPHDAQAVEPTASEVPAPPRPTPGPPKPGPRPGPRPHAPAAPEVVVHAHHQPQTDPSRFGHIDADGAVWLEVGEIRRQVGSWQAGAPEEGLAHFGRRFDDMATEVEILEERLAAGTGDPRKTKTAAVALRETLPTAAVLGDVTALEARLTAIIDDADSVAEKRTRERDASRAAAIARKEELAAEAEQIGAETTQWKSAGDRLRAILDEWKTIKGVDRKTDDVLWKRYAKARDAFNRRRGAHFADLDRERAGAKSRKEELIAAAEALSGSTDWGPTAGKFRDLLTDWKAAGRAPRDQDDALWERFKGAQDVFFAARNAAGSERDAEFDANAAAKRELLVTAEKTVDPATDLEAARREFRTIREQWDAIGKVPREHMQSLEKRMRAIEKRISDAEEKHWRSTDPEVIARAKQFEARVAQLEEQADKADARGRDREAADLRAQAQQWREWAQAAASAVSDR
ncbi:DUF349 domain-containing protein [Williamsia phyllosphaerae]|nr:DUF349 domain-containing protein [Williamsia phyllosphaerae]